MEHINLYALFQQFYPEKNCTIRFESEVIGNDDSSIKRLHFTKVTRKCKCFGRIVEP
jgi:IS1 family transposase